MVATIEEQIHQCLIEEEEKRCQMEETKRAAEGKDMRKPINRRKIAKPWTRSGPYALCQEVDLLPMIDEYDYDLTDIAFLDYCRSRGVLHLAGAPSSRRWDYFADYSKSKNDYLADENFWFAQEFKGKRHRYTEKELNSSWEIVVLGRAKLQDCWELYCNSMS
jgi:hypothetical protein